MYEAKPLELTEPKAHKILNECIKFETMFSDYQPACEKVCGYCAKCWARKATIAGHLVALNTLAYEVWNDAELVGIMYVRDIVPGHDALAEFTFWDRDLRGKAQIINNTLDRAVFGGDLKLHRVTTEVPVHMKALCNFIQKKLGFVREGVKREALLWHGHWEDVAIFGKLNGNTEPRG
jgi:RimJ/RimL family protein N-acetyltransferase